MNEPAEARARAAAWLCMAVPALFTLQAVLRFGVPVPYFDEWTYVDTLRDVTEHGLSLRALFAFHNDHWIVIPRALMLLLDRFSGFDTRVEMVASFLVTCATCAVLFIRYGKKPLWLVPVVSLLFCMRQFENQLWGWQLQIYLCVFFAAAAFEVLARGRALPGLALALCATWSFSAGLLVWPIGLALLWPARRKAALFGAAFALMLLAYAANYHKPEQTPSLLFALSAPVKTLHYLLYGFGASFGWTPGSAVGGTLVCGFCGFVAVTLWRGERGAPSPALALLAFGVGAVCLLALGRAGFGADQALDGRYSTLALWVPAGIWLLLLEAAPSARRTAALCVLGGALCIAVLDGDLTGFSAAARGAAQRIEAADHLLDVERRPDADLLPLMDQPQTVRRHVPWLRERRLSLFRYVEP